MILTGGLTWGLAPQFLETLKPSKDCFIESVTLVGTEAIEGYVSGSISFSIIWGARPQYFSFHYMGGLAPIRP